MLLSFGDTGKTHEKIYQYILGLSKFINHLPLLHLVDQIRLDFKIYLSFHDIVQNK